MELTALRAVMASTALRAIPVCTVNLAAFQTIFRQPQPVQLVRLAGFQTTPLFYARRAFRAHMLRLGLVNAYAVMMALGPIGRRERVYLAAQGEQGRTALATSAILALHRVAIERTVRRVARNLAGMLTKL